MSDTLSIVKKRDVRRIPRHAGSDSRLNESPPERDFVEYPGDDTVIGPAQVALRFELFGWLLTATTALSVIRLPALTEMTANALTGLPPLRGNKGYYFPSAILPGGRLPAAPEGYFFVERARYPRYFLDLNQTLDAFMASKSSKTRSTLRRKLRKFEDASGGEIDWRIYRTPAEMAEFHRLAIGLARRTYQARLYSAALPEDEDFYNGMMARAANGHLAAFLLFLGGEPVAYLFAPIAGRRIIYGFLGFDTDHAKLSPGVVLQLRAMQWCFERGDLDLFDFTEGEGSHKALFSSYSRPCCDLVLLRKHPGLRVVVALYNLSRATSRVSSGLLDRLGLKRRIRQWMRQSSAG